MRLLLYRKDGLGFKPVVSVQALLSFAARFRTVAALQCRDGILSPLP